MNSDDLSSDTEEDKNKDDALMPQVVDYYNKFSQNRKLLTYFCGTATELKPNEWTETERKQDVEIFTYEKCENTGRPPLIGRAKSPTIHCSSGESPDTQTCENLRLMSPASSITSNRKLEWDNGADIGYGNCQTLQKSTSLPAIIVQQDDSLRASFTRFSPEGRKTDSSFHLKSHSSSDDNNELLFLPAAKETDTSDEDGSDTKVNIETASHVKDRLTSDTDSDGNTERITVIKKSDSVHQKIGKPVAESTPLYGFFNTKYSKTTDLKRPERPLYFLSMETNTKEENTSSSDTIESKKVSSAISEKSSGSSKTKKSSSCENLISYKESSRKIVNLCITKPITIECTSSKSSKDKIVQTSLTRNNSTSVQTENLMTKMVRNVPSNKKPHAAVLYTQHSDTERERNTHSSSAQTDSDVFVSKCNSFEYLYGEAYDQNVKATENGSVQHEVDPLQSKKSESEKSGPDSSNSKSTPLAQLISKKQSNHLITDIEKSIALIQKLANSKRYDDITKKYYLKKIIEKIVGNCYTDDSSQASEVRSEKLTNKKASEETNTVRNTQQEEYLRNNIPWVPAKQDEDGGSLRKGKQLKLQTFSDQILPDNNTEDFVERFSKPYNTSDSSGGPPKRKPRLAKKSRFTLADDECAFCYPVESSTTSPTSGTSASCTVAKKRKECNWKEEKTASEKLLEEQALQKKHRSGESEADKFANGQRGDHLLTFAKRERWNQVNWINNEITHLSRLKLLLEKGKKSGDVDNRVRSKTVECILSKPRVQDLKGIKKSTTVYMITTEKSEQSSIKEAETDDTQKGVSDITTSDNNSADKKQTACMCCTCNTIKLPPFGPVSTGSRSSLNSQVNARQVENQNICCYPVCPSKGKGPLDLKNAQLVANQVFKTCTDKKNAKASVYRYTFEIPLFNATGSKKPGIAENKTAGSVITCTCCKKSKGECVCCGNEMRTNQIQQTEPSKTKDVCTGPCVEKRDKKCWYKADYKCICTQTDPESTGNKCICTTEKKNECTESLCLPSERIKETQDDGIRISESLTGNYLQSDRQSRTSRQSSVQTDIDAGKSRKFSNENGVQTDTIRHQFGRENDVESDADGQFTKQSGTRADDTGSRLMSRQGSVQTDRVSKLSRQSSVQVDAAIGTSTKRKMSREGSVQTRNYIQNDHNRDSESLRMEEDGDEHIGRNREVNKQRDEIYTKHGENKLGKREDSSHERKNKSKANGEKQPKAIESDEEDPEKRTSFTQTKPLVVGTTDNKKINTRSSAESIKSDKNPKSSSSGVPSSSSSSETSEMGIRLCPCCRKNRISLPSEFSIGGLTDYENKPSHILCHPCYMGSGQIESFGPKPFYTFPQHVCNCYTYMKTSTVKGIREAVKELQRLEAYEEYCTCLYRGNKSNAIYCAYCSCKLKNAHKRNGIAYQITFEKGTPEENKENLHKRRSLEEIKIKVPAPYHHKKHKDKKNKDKTEKENGEEKKTNDEKEIEETKKSHHKHHTTKITLQVLVISLYYSILFDSLFFLIIGVSVCESARLYSVCRRTKKMPAGTCIYA